jgi:hypothetical protein
MRTNLASPPCRIVERLFHGVDHKMQQSLPFALDKIEDTPELRRISANEG